MVRAVSGRTSRSGEENCEDASLASPPKKRHCVLPTEIEVEEGEIADPDMNVGMNAPEVETRTTSVEDAPPIGHDQGTDTAQTPPATENENPLDAAAAPPASAIFTNEEMYPDAPFPSSPEYYAILEKAYWKNLTFHSPIYGADMYDRVLLCF